MKNKIIIGGVIALIVIVGAGRYYYRTSIQEGSYIHESREKVEENQDKNGSQDKPEKEKSGASTTPHSAGIYEPYSADNFAKASTGKIVLFFHAGWCPECRALDADIIKRSKEIPADLTILKVDYDTATDLKQKYGVTYQNTFVQVDTHGTLIQKWSGASTLAQLEEHLQ